MIGRVRRARDHVFVPPRPHPFLWVYALALGLGAFAAGLAPGRAPAVALYWNPIYRLEIGVVVVAGLYVLTVAGWMAWHGHAFRRIELPGGAAIERDAEELDAAATHFDAFKDTTAARLDALEEAVEHLAEPDAGRDRTDRGTIP